MSGPRKIRAKTVYLFVEDGDRFLLRCRTEKGAFYDVTFHLDDAKASLWIDRLTPVITSTIRHEKAKHERHKKRLADAWAAAKQAIEGVEPGSPS